MAYFYFYTPCFAGTPPGFTDPETGDTYSPAPVKEPGQDNGGGVQQLTNRPRGMAILKYDDPETRCVVRLPTASPRVGWVSKTSGEVLTDYPGLPGVV